MSTSEGKSPTVDVGTLARLFNLTAVRVQQLAKDGVVIKGERGRYDLWGSIRGYIKFLQERRVNQWDDGGEDGDYAAHRARLTKAKADMAEMEAALRKGEAHDAEAVAKVWGDMLMNAKAKLLSMPTSLAGIIHGEESTEVIRNTIEGAVMQALNELAEYDPALVTNEYVQSHSEPLEDATEVEDEPVGGQPPKAVKRGKRRTRAVENEPG